MGLLLKAPGVDIEATDTLLMSPIHFALQGFHQNLACVNILLDAGANIDKEGPGGKKPLHFAADSGWSEAVALLCSKGVDVNIFLNEKSRTTPLHIAAQTGKEGVIYTLISLGADRSILNSANQSAADLALAAGHASIANILRSDKSISKSSPLSSSPSDSSSMKAGSKPSTLSTPPVPRLRVGSTPPVLESSHIMPEFEDLPDVPAPVPLPPRMQQTLDDPLKDIVDDSSLKDYTLQPKPVLEDSGRISPLARPVEHKTAQSPILPPIGSRTRSISLNIQPRAAPTTEKTESSPVSASPPPIPFHSRPKSGTHAPIVLDPKTSSPPPVPLHTRPKSGSYSPEASRLRGSSGMPSSPDLRRGIALQKLQARESSETTEEFLPAPPTELLRTLGTPPPVRLKS
eukprot:TRINITY_DN2373_c0_g1_i6.p1 TRINITY_DN2373_c0_g1~~TRINITY_DN2373_c0_g1_i6.p1  ORF type:complete len:412 (-),score=-10.68 TRINITY_DN2373_c0_g1_i6:211-1416(-)